MRTGAIALRPRKTLQNAAAVGHEPGGLLGRRAVNLGHHPKHADHNRQARSEGTQREGAGSMG
eukprot:11203016-Lingulodinium_polyedra.AAC.1